MSDERSEAPSESSLRSSTFSAAQNQVIWVVWLTYGAFYFCRTNMSAAVPGLKAPIAEGGLGMTAAQVGIILASLKIAYAFGQLLNGQLSEHFSPRRMLAIGMCCSAGLNVLFGFGTAFYFLLFIWAFNGYSQSLGWTPCVRVTANWIPVEKRGKAIGIIGTGYQVTLGLTFLLASFAAQQFGWRGALFVPAVVLASAGVFMWFFLEESPGDRGSDGNETTASHPSTTPKGTFFGNLLITLSNRNLWFLGLSLGLLNACRYGFLDWGLTHLTEVQDTSLTKAGLKYACLPIGAVAGSYLAGWATDRFFNSRRAPVVCMLLVLLGVLTLCYDSVARTSEFLTVILLLGIGFCIYGPQVLLVGTAPADLARRGTSAAAAGFVNFIGYLGAASGDYVTGRYLDAKDGGWEAAIYVWAGWAFGAAIISSFLWNATSNSDGDTDHHQSENKGQEQA